MKKTENTYDLISYMEELVKKENEKKEWWNLKDSCKRKGINYKTVCNKTYLQPNNGKPDAVVGGRKVWNRSTIEEWVMKTDSDMLKEFV